MTINFDIVKDVAEWAMAKLLPKFTIFTGVFLGLGALTLAVTSAMKLPYFHLPEQSHPALMETGKYAAAFWVFLALATIVSEIRRASNLRVQIAAEQIRMNPNVPDSSSIPAVHDEIARQIVAGTPPEVNVEPSKPEGGSQ